MRGEERHDVLEQDALLGPVGELPQPTPEHGFEAGQLRTIYLSTGLFGGTGGRGGGESSLGGILYCSSGLAVGAVELGMRLGLSWVRFGRRRVRRSGRLVGALGAWVGVRRVTVRWMLVEGDGLAGHGGRERPREQYVRDKTGCGCSDTTIGR